jgi:hypothetical protein
MNRSIVCDNDSPKDAALTGARMEAILRRDIAASTLVGTPPTISIQYYYRLHSIWFAFWDRWYP